MDQINKGKVVKSPKGMAYIKYKDLFVWQKAMIIVEKVYELTKTLPADERFGLVSQMRRSAISVPSNIAEGKSRGTRRDYSHFIAIARGSLAELDTQVLLCVRLGYARDDDNLLTLIYELQRMLASLSVKLRFPPCPTSST